MHTGLGVSNLLIRNMQDWGNSEVKESFREHNGRFTGQLRIRRFELRIPAGEHYYLTTKLKVIFSRTPTINHRIKKY